MGVIKLSRPVDRAGTLKAIEKRKCEMSLAEFVKAAWHIIEPGQQYVHGFHIDFICAHLEAITDGELNDDGTFYNRLLVNVPPGTMKSLLIGVFWPAWEWGPRNMPHMRYVCASHSLDLAIRDSLRMRRLVTSEWYQFHWGDRVKITGDQNAKAKFETTATGFRQACAFTGITGYRGDRVIVDDPHSVDDANSDAKRKTATDLFKEAVTSRLNNPDRSAIVVVMQRLHEADVSGIILDNDMGYDHIMLPMRFDPNRACVTRLGYADPREIDGELLFPDRFPEHVVDRDEAAMGPYATAGQYAQSPEPRGGGIVKDAWWKLWDKPEYPGIEYIVAALDTAYTEKSENDPSALTIWGVFSASGEQASTRMVDRYGRPIESATAVQSEALGATAKVMLMYAWQDKLNIGPLVEKVEELCTRMRVDLLLIENKAAGHSVAQEIRRVYNSAKFGVQMYDPKTLDKVARLYSIQHIFSEGMVYAPNKDWAEMVIRQTSSFPRGAHDDLVDTVSMGLKHLRDVGMLTRAPERLAEIEDSKVFHGNNQDAPLYNA
jgi:predicted phage terminase large subunit-like protein